MEIHVPANDFSSLGDPNVLYKHTIVRVHYVWKDNKRNKLYLILLDRNVSIKFEILTFKTIFFSYLT